MLFVQERVSKIAEGPASLRAPIGSPAPHQDRASLAYWSATMELARAWRWLRRRLPARSRQCSRLDRELTRCDSFGKTCQLLPPGIVIPG